MRGQLRSDRMDEAWVQHGIDIWKRETRRSERAKDSVRNPTNKSDKILYRVHWLECRIGDIQQVIEHEGQRKFDQPEQPALAATGITAAVPAKPAVKFH